MTKIPNPDVMEGKADMQDDVTLLKCSQPCTKVIKIMTDHEVLSSKGITSGGYFSIDGYRFINIFVQFSQEKEDELPVDLGLMFAFNETGTLGARCYVNLEENLAGLQSTNVIEVSGSGCWHGGEWKISSYVVRLPVMGPFIQCFVYNRATFPRVVSVWAYLMC
jgi:hypothetical protein